MAPICEKNIYGENSVEKLECIGHIQKRIGSQLHKLKSTTPHLKGKGKLTHQFIDRLQTYYDIQSAKKVFEHLRYFVSKNLY